MWPSHLRISFFFFIIIIAISDQRDRFNANNSAVATRFPNTFGEAFALLSSDYVDNDFRIFFFPPSRFMFSI